ncbi:MAG: hypothetical protein ABIV36_11600 [Sphingobium limneticum]
MKNDNIAAIEDLDDAELMDLGTASELTEGQLGGTFELQSASSRIAPPDFG